MIIQHSAKARTLVTSPQVFSAMEAVAEPFLRSTVEAVSIPRHVTEQADNNRLAAQWIARQFREFGYEVELQGPYSNVIALPREKIPGPLILVGAHYDSVPGTPGADDNGSAVAAMLGCAKAVAEHAPRSPVCFASFNCEEDGLLGSANFVTDYLPARGLTLGQTHILEMVGYCDHRPGSQSVPSRLPVKAPSAGDFLGLIGNNPASAAMDTVLQTAKSYLPEFPVLGLKVYLGVEKLFPVLLRSDHAPFWEADLPALMWTDTSEFRNPNYHKPSDTPDTLDYAFLRQVTQLLVATVLTEAQMMAA